MKFWLFIRLRKTKALRDSASTEKAQKNVSNYQNYDVKNKNIIKCLESVNFFVVYYIRFRNT